MKAILLFATLVLSGSLVWSLPESHPGSDSYDYEYLYKKIEIDGRQVEVFVPHPLPKTDLPLVVFAHGQAQGMKHYKQNFIHLARKGIAVIFPYYDKGFFDRNWERMASDYVSLTQKFIDENDFIDEDRVVFSGHSKGAYIALMATGAPNLRLHLKAGVFFALAGFNESYLTRIDPTMPLTIVWGQEDRISPFSISEEAYQLAASQNKQLVLAKGREGMRPGHFFVNTKKFLGFGYSNLNDFHYELTWKYLVSAALEQGKSNSYSDYIYGTRAAESGDEFEDHQILRSF